MNQTLALMERAAELAQEPASTNRRAGFRLLHRLEENERFLRRTCEQLLSETRTGRSLEPGAAWLLDNYSYIQSLIREIREAMPRGYYRDLPRVAEGPSQGDPRVYRLATEVLAHTDAEIHLEVVALFFKNYQSAGCRPPLLLAELWAIGPMLKIALIEKLRAAVNSDLTIDEPAVSEAITGLRALELAPWRDFVESICAVEQVLRQDPAGFYADMDFETRDSYRHAVESISHQSDLTEEEVAGLAVDLSRKAAARHVRDPRQQHVGYYLAGPGVGALKRRAGYRAPLLGAAHDMIYRHPNVLYLGGAALATLVLMALITWLLFPVPAWMLALLLVPASQVAFALINPLVNFLVRPRRLPRLDFSQGIPDDCRTFVVVPTLLLSRTAVEKLLERLEIHYLANRDPNLFFALLTDYPDSTQPDGAQDYLLNVCAEGIRLLNARYASAEGSPFYLFHRPREWNPGESVWMGRERKRGKLSDFNRLLLGDADAFSQKIGDLSVLRTIRYVITLDSDTQLPRDTARKMIATLAHPLNRPIIDPVTETVRDGYAILQPRVSVSMESAGRSLLAQIYSGQTGFDPYTTAVSDVYQDLHGQASYTGKGIYDVRAFQRVAGARFPENTLLSHDLIEGEYARTGLITDLELIDDYPASYQAYSKRKHRWVRGDWQIARWLRPRVFGRQGEPEPNPLPPLSRWKIADNLRRSLLEISLFALLLAGWFCLPGGPFRATLVVLGVLLAPAYIEFGWALVRLPGRRFWHSQLREAAFRLARGHLDALLGLTFLAHQAFLMADAVGRTLVRMFVTRRKLLEWESMAQSEESTRRRTSPIDRYLLVPPALALLAFLLPGISLADAVAVIVLELWMFSPLFAKWLNASPVRKQDLSADDTDFLHDLALRTWRYFQDLSAPEHHWLVPDNVQEEPPNAANRTSPTNLGLLLASHLTAHDFGYTTRLDLAQALERVFETIDRLERYHGHFYNWYDTHTLLPLPPRYVSTVDSGNLAASLLALKQGCLELLSQPAIDFNVLAGLRDHCIRLRNALPPLARTSSIQRLVASLLRQLEYRPTDLFFWESVLTEAGATIRGLREHVEWVRKKLEPAQSEEVEYWYGALVARADSALADLYALAPWLARPYEQELRLHSTDESLRELLAELARVVKLADLPHQYAAIESKIRARLASREPLLPAACEMLEDLLLELPAAAGRAARLVRIFEEHAAQANRLAEEMDFVFLFDEKRKLIHLGYDATAGRMDPAYYDLLASEARTAVFLAIAKGDIPREAWFHLGRKLAAFQGARTLLSWSGTLFEYLMPCLFMRTYDHTLLGESLKTVVRIQQRYAADRGLPWGISEAAYNSRDSALNYQYQAFGIPRISLKHNFGDDLVVAPYASILALMVDRTAATANLRDMAARGWTGRYGFFESIDHSPRRLAAHQRSAVVRAFMGHHQAMSLLSLSSVLLPGPMQRRFHADPLVQATEFLLQERVPVLFETATEEQPLSAELALIYEQWKAGLRAQANSAVG